MPVAVEVRGDAAVALNARVRVRARAHVDEAAGRRSRRARSAGAAPRLPRLGVRVGVRVDGEEVEPAVVVVVEPAETAAHHPVYVVRHAEAEVVLREVEPDLRRDVGEPDAVEAPATVWDDRRERNGPAAAHVRDDPATALLQRARRLVQRRRGRCGARRPAARPCTRSAPSCRRARRRRRPGPDRARPRGARASGRGDTWAPRSFRPRPRGSGSTARSAPRRRWTGRARRGAAATEPSPAAEDRRRDRRRAAERSSVEDAVDALRREDRDLRQGA